jgi:TonB family protein
MTSLAPRSSDAASSWMLATSACIHGICILAIVISSGSFRKPQTPPTEPVARVKLVEPAAGPPVLEKVQPSLASEPAPAPAEEPVQLVEPIESPPKTQAVVTGKSAEPVADSIKVAKRKKRMRHVKAPEAPEKPSDKRAEKPADEPVKKKEDPDEFLAKRLAALRKEVETKKTDAVDRQVGPKFERPAVAGGGGTRQGSDAVDKELLQWFAAVRTKINAKWSVFASYRHLDRVTVVGVQIADDGRLIGAAVDESSGDEVLDRSAMRAVFQASPFPQVPVEVAERIRKAGGLALRFTVKGLQ